MYPDPDPQNYINPDPDPGRIKVNKITKFSKHLLIFKSKKTFNFQVTNLLFFKFRLEKYNLLRKIKIFVG